MASRAREADAIYWADKPFEFFIIDGVAGCRVRSGGVALEYRSTIHVARLGVRSWAKADAEHIAEQAVAVVMFPKRKH